MKITLRLIIPLLIVAAMVAVGFSFYQVRQENTRLVSDLERRAVILAESLQESVIPLIQENSLTRLDRLAERFSNRERLKGIIVFDEQGNIMASTPKLRAAMKKQPLPQAVSSITENSPSTGFTEIGNDKTYLYTQPLISGDKPVGAIAILYDSAYIDVRLNEIWRTNLLRFFTLSVLIAAITLLIIRWSITGPIADFANWMREVRTGKTRGAAPIPVVRGDILAPLISEAAHLAKSLSLARARAEEEARLRVQADTVWTAGSLKEQMHTILGDKKLYVISNREPYMHVREGRDIKCITPAGGLVTALDPVMKACDGVWIAHGSGDVDRSTVDAQDKLRVPPEEPAYTLKRVWLTKEEEDGYYYGFSNEGLWPLCHITHTRPTFRLDDWMHYQTVNAKFAEALLDEIAGEESPLILVQDYQLALVPMLIKEKRPDARVAIFWHIPWPNPEAYGICPWHREILLGMLGADIIGFHIQFHCNNFLDTVDRFLESKVDWELFSVDRGGHTTIVKPFPISVSFEGISAKKGPAEPAVTKEGLFRQIDVSAQYLAVGVDRIDYTKGIPERLRAIERFFEKYPDYIGTFTYVELGAPSRTHIKRYRDLATEIEEMVDRINWRFKTRTWRPIAYLKAHHSHEDIAPFYRLSDICLVTSLHDGMNLVAKEFVATREDGDGVLVLSQFAGASRELRDALIVNPYDIEEMADAIYIALTMAPEERKERMKHMRAFIRENNIFLWAGNLTSALANLRTSDNNYEKTN